MSSFYYTDAAEQDLLMIWARIAADDREAADRFLRKVDAVSQLACRFPEVGSVRDELPPGMRLLRVQGAYLMLYTPLVGEVEITRVVHGAQNWPSWFEQP